jgi:hypothetical protein
MHTETYCVIEVTSPTRNYCGGSINLHFVPLRGERLKLDSGMYIVEHRYSNCTHEDGNHCVLIVSESVV